ncbi:MAG: osmoprotectant transporter permease [Siphonobacter aquaeclarae]|nr:osmoprotectant transporter permease [Siphonobacter aquaeclarae]
MIFFRILWGIDAVVALVIVYFFFVGIGDGSVSSFNMGLWLLILSVLAIVLGGSLWLRRKQQPVLANLLLSVVAVPGVLYGLFVLLLVVTNPHWQ